MGTEDSSYVYGILARGEEMISGIRSYFVEWQKRRAVKKTCNETLRLVEAAEREQGYIADALNSLRAARRHISETQIDQLRANCQHIFTVCHRNFLGFIMPLRLAKSHRHLMYTQIIEITAVETATLILYDKLDGCICRVNT